MIGGEFTAGSEPTLSGSRAFRFDELIKVAVAIRSLQSWVGTRGQSRRHVGSALADAPFATAFPCPISPRGFAFWSAKADPTATAQSHSRCSAVAAPAHPGLDIGHPDFLGFDKPEPAQQAVPIGDLDRQARAGVGFEHDGAEVGIENEVYADVFHLQPVGQRMDAIISSCHCGS